MAEPQGTRPRSRGWTWIRRTAWIGLAVLGVARLTLQFWLPSAMDAAVSGLGLRCDYEGFDLSVLGADVELRHVDVWSAEEENTPPLAHVEYARLDVDISSLLLFDLRIHRVELDGVDTRLERSREGRWLLPTFGTREASSVTEASDRGEAGAEEPPERWDLSSPVQIDAIRAQHVRLHLIDGLTGIDTVFDSHLRLSDIGHGSRPVRLELSTTCLDFVDALTVDVDGRLLPRTARFDASLAARGLRPGPLGSLLEEFGLRPTARTHEIAAALHIEVDSAEDRPRLDLRAGLEDLSWTADGIHHMGLSSTSAVAAIEPGRVEVEGVDLEALRVQVGRSPAGELQVAGFDLIPPRVRTVAAPGAHAQGEAEVDPSGAEPADPESNAGGTGRSDLPVEPAPPLAWGIGRVDLAGIELALRDAAVQPPTELAVHLDSLHVEDVGPGRATRFELIGGLRPTGSAWSVEGALDPSPAGTSLEARVAVEGSDLSTLDPWLTPLGLRGDERAAHLSVEVAAALHEDGDGQRVEATLSSLALEGAGDLLRLPAARLRLALDEREVRVDELRLEGARLSLTKAADGSFAVAGLRTIPAVPASATAPSPESSTAPQPSGASGGATSTAAPVAPPKRVVLTRVVLEDAALHLVDARAEAPHIFEVSAGAELRDLVLNGDGVRTARLECASTFEGLGRVALDADLTTRPGPLDLELFAELHGEALDLTPLSWLFEDAGIEPRLTDGSLAGEVRASVKRPGDTLQLGLDLSGLRYADGRTELLALDRLRISDLEAGPAGLRVAPVSLEGVRAELRRDAAGVLHVAGFAIPGRTEAAPPAPGSAGAGDQGSKAAAPAPSSGTESAALTTANGDPGTPTDTDADEDAGFECGGLTLEGLAVRWIDEGLDPAGRSPNATAGAVDPGDAGDPVDPVDAGDAGDAVETVLTGNIQVGALALGRETSLELELGLADALESLRIQGSLTLSPSAPRASVDLSARGIRGGLIDRYLPPGQAIGTADGRLSLHLEGSLDPLESGGLAVNGALRDLVLRDGDDGEVQLGVGEVSVVVPRVDGERIEITEAAVRGIELSVEQRDGGWLACGLRIDPAPAAAESESAVDGAAAGAGGASASPAERAPATEAPGAEPEPAVELSPDEVLAAMDAAETALPPRIEVQRLAIEVDRLRIRSEGAQPLDVAFDLHNRSPLALIGPEPEDLPPWEFLLAGSSPTALDRFEVRLDAHPWQFEPTAEIAAQMEGLHGQALHDSLPSLLEGLDLSEISAGRAGLQLAARMDLRRRVPTEFDLSRGFGLELELSEASYRASDGGPVLAGVESVYLNAPRLGGESGAVHIAELAIDGIVGRASIDAAGTHVLGVTIPPAVPPGAQPGVDVEAPTAVEETPGGGAGVAAAGPEDGGANPVAPDRPEGEAAKVAAPPLRVDQIAVNGLDFLLEDRSFDPPLIVPLDELAVSVTGLRVGGEQAPGPVRFEVALGAGEVELPKRARASSLVAGVLSAAAAVATGGSDEVDVEPRSILDEFVVSGSVVPSATPTGAVEVNVTGLELLALRGPALAGGVEIGSGVFDGRVQFRMEEGGGSRTKARLVMADLGLDEPPGGPISTYLKLPAPLQTVLFVLKDADNEIAVPLDLELDSNGGVSGRKIAASAVSAFGSIVTDAVASSAFRVGGVVTGLFGFGGPKEIPEEATVVLDYAPGVVELPEGFDRRCEVLLDVLKDDEMIAVLQPVLGLDDLARAEALATPSGSDRLALVAELRQRKLALWRDRDQRSTELATGRRLGTTDRLAVLEAELARIDGDLGRTERALDNVLVLLRDGADRRGPRRARELAMEFATERARLVRERLVALGPEGLGERIEVRRARLPGAEALGQGVLGLVPRRRAE